MEAWQRAGRVLGENVFFAMVWKIKNTLVSIMNHAKL